MKNIKLLFFIIIILHIFFVTPNKIFSQETITADNNKFALYRNRAPIPQHDSFLILNDIIFLPLDNKEISITYSSGYRRNIVPGQKAIILNDQVKILPTKPYKKGAEKHKITEMMPLNRIEVISVDYKILEKIDSNIFNAFCINSENYNFFNNPTIFSMDTYEAEYKYYLKIIESRIFANNLNLIDDSVYFYLSLFSYKSNNMNSSFFYINKISGNYFESDLLKAIILNKSVDDNKDTKTIFENNFNNKEYRDNLKFLFPENFIKEEFLDAIRYEISDFDKE